MGVATERNNPDRNNVAPDSPHDRTLSDDSGPLKFERRACERWPAIGPLEARRCDCMCGEGKSAMMRIELVDEGSGGLAAVTQAPMPPGSRLSVRSSPASDIWRLGVVVRCTPSGDGYRIGVAYERRQAA